MTAKRTKKDQVEAVEATEISPVVMIGVPCDENSSFRRGAAAAPRAIREQLHSGSANLCSERGLDLHDHPGWQDLGDLASPQADWFDVIERAASEILAQGARPFFLGGDHSITYPIVRAAARYHQGLTLVHFDAHPDLYDELDGNRHSHACPFARIMEEGLVDRLVQVGIRTLNTHQREQAERFGVEILEMRDFRDGAAITLHAPMYVSVDLDVLDPAFAPGVSHQEPGGMTTRDLIDLLHELPGPIVGGDLVELNPAADLGGQTAMVAAKLVKELVAQMLLEPASADP